MRLLCSTRTTCIPSKPCAVRCFANTRMLSIVTVRADASGFNPFKKDSKKEEAARKALQEMFQGKKDILQAYDAKPEQGGGGGGKGGFGGGGGFGGFGGFGNFSDWGDRFWKFFRGLGNTVGAVVLFILAIGAFSLWQPLTTLFVQFVRYALRLDARGAARARAQKAKLISDEEAARQKLGSTERAVLEKFGQTEAQAEQEQAAAAEDLEDEDL